MSTTSARQHVLVDAGTETRPPMLERCSYIPWARRFRRYLNRKRETRKDQNEDDLTGDDLKQYKADIEAMSLILISIPNDIYNSMNSCQTAKDMWLRPEWYKYVTNVRLAKNMKDESYDVLFDYLWQYEKVVIASRVKKAAKTHDPRALVAYTICTSSNTRNQAVVQSDRVNIQSRNVGNGGRIARRSYNTQEASAESSNVQKEPGNVQRTLRTSSSGNATNIKELSAKICMMARIQQANTDSDEGPSYDSAFISEVQTPSPSFMNPLFSKSDHEQTYHEQHKIINSTNDDDQINSDIIFDDPNVEVNDGSIEHDENAHD
ncbi:hypothetical protein Tco_0939825 [Tanacetum coccineum]|uniref:Uncharacterized protein n=1 Tax=Tanacetum coccineum TaxID=301880 RepID=A0ABQ5DL92_9ASTR